MEVGIFKYGQSDHPGASIIPVIGPLEAEVGRLPRDLGQPGYVVGSRQA